MADTFRDAPIQDDVIEGFASGKAPEGFLGKAKLSWILFFQRLAQGDVGTSWTPGANNLAFSGAAPTISGRYFKNQGFTDVIINITPGTNTTSTAGTTYFDLPFRVSANGANHAVSGLLGTNAGMIDQASNRLYPPSWSAVSVPLTIVGRCLS